MSTIPLPRKEGDLGQYFKDGSFIPWDEYDFEQEYYLDLSQDFPQKELTPGQSYRNHLIDCGFSPLRLLSSEEYDEMLEREEQAEIVNAKAAGPLPPQQRSRQKTVGVPLVEANTPTGVIPRKPMRSCIVLPRQEGDTGLRMKDGRIIPWSRVRDPSVPFHEHIFLDSEREEQAEIVKAKAVCSPPSPPRSDDQENDGTPVVEINKPTAVVPRKRPDIPKKPDHLRSDAVQRHKALKTHEQEVMECQRKRFLRLL
jgi:hypothetical protein